MTQAVFNFNHNILCVGDLMLDEYIYGDTSRISPEAPVPVVNHQDTLFSLGGVGNVARNLVALQAQQVNLVGLLGNDETAVRIANLAQMANINLNPIVDDTFTSVKKLRVISRHQQLLRVDYEKEYHLSDEALELILADEELNTAIEQSSAVILSDYNKGMRNLFPAVIAKATELGKLTFVDPKASDWSFYAGASLIKPNYREFVDAVKFNFPELTAQDMHDNEQQLASELMQRYNLGAMVITKADKGLSIYLPDGNAWDVATAAEEVYDVTGAGDTTLASLVLSFLTMRDLPLASLIATRAAGISISRVGTVAVTNAELFQACGDFLKFVDGEGNELTAEQIQELGEQTLKEKAQEVTGSTSQDNDSLVEDASNDLTTKTEPVIEVGSLSVGNSSVADEQAEANELSDDQAEDDEQEEVSQATVNVTSKSSYSQFNKKKVNKKRK